MYATGLTNLDKTFGGARRGELTVIASAHGLCPSRLLLPILRYTDEPTLVFASETSDLMRDLRRRPNLFIDDSGHRDFKVIAKRARAARDALGIRGVVIEDLRLIRGARYNDMRSKLRKAFAALPAELGVAVIVGWMSECKRDTPRWSDLRCTIAEDPDLLILMSVNSYADNSRRVFSHRQDRAATADDELWVPGIA